MKKTTSLLLSCAVATSLGTAPVFADTMTPTVQPTTQAHVSQYGSFQFTPRFSDVALNNYAIRYITEMSARGVISGVGNGRFLPFNSVTKEQAVIMAVAAMGLKSQALALGQNATLNIPDANSVDSWARPYLSLALQKGFVDANTTFGPKQAADREWVVQLIIRALGLQNEADAHMQDSLSYKDAASIDPAYIGYIAVATDDNIVHGTDDHRFLPQAPVQRGQMAAMLSNSLHLIAYDPDHQVQTQGEWNGTITSVTSTGITLQTPSGQAVTFPFAGQYYVFLGEAFSNSSALKTGMWARVLLDPQGQIVFVQATAATPAPVTIDAHANGTVTSFVAPTATTAGSITIQQSYGEQPPTVEPRTMQLTLAVAPNVQVTSNGTALTFDQIKPGNHVNLSIDDNTVVSIAVAQQVAQPISAPGPISPL